MGSLVCNMPYNSSESWRGEGRGSREVRDEGSPLRLVHEFVAPQEQQLDADRAKNDSDDDEEMRPQERQ